MTAKGVTEGIYVTSDVMPSAQLYYRKHSEGEFVKYPYSNSSGGSCLVLGLSAGSYDVRLVNADGAIGTVSGVDVTSYHRSGYAHFGASEGVGAYNDEGTLKDNAQVVYVSDVTKNTVACTINGKSYVGLVKILQAASKSSNPLDIRVIGKISTNQFASKVLADKEVPFDHPEYYENAIETTYSSNLEGLAVKAMGPSTAETYWNKTVASYSGYSYTFSNKTSSGDTDSYFNMLDVSAAKNVTVEGVTPDACIEQWGFTWSRCNSIEVRNLLFENYVEDACSFQGGSNSDMDYSRFWLHNCRFNRGLNNWDLTEEQDKGDGDGGFDIKYLHNITSSNNIFYNTHKTGLIGGSDSAYTMNVTFHHNLYEKCSARLPLGRQANMHFYNNYYLNCGTCQDIRAHAYCFSESNYFEKCDYPQKISSSAMIKSYLDVFSSCSNSSKATIVSDRTSELTNTCKPDGKADYSSFTTSSSLFYYDSASKTSSVSNLLEASGVPTYVKANAGSSVK